MQPARFLMITSLLAVACTSGPSGVDSDSLPPGDTGETTDRPTDDTDDTDVEGTDDTDGPPVDTAIDTAACLFGELSDCNRRCFPEHFVGDGFCDDGETLQADFSCRQYAFDGGDCEADTDVVGPTGCDYAIRVHTELFAGEIGWRLQDAQGRVLARVPFATYLQDGRTYEYPLTLESGTYTFVAQDAAGDGWTGGWWELIDLKTGRQLARYQGPGLLVAEREYTVDVTCGGESGCGLDVITLGGADGPDMGWELRTLDTNVLIATQLPGATPVDGRTETRVEVYDGVAYTLRGRDARGGGWDGRIEARFEGGLLLDTLGLPTTGNPATTDLRVRCDDAGLGAFDAPGPTIAPSDCSRVRAETVAGVAQAELSWSLWRVEPWQRVVGLAAGSLPLTGATFPAPIPATGLYLLRATDAGGDGWSGGLVRLVDDVDERVLVEVDLPRGHHAPRYLQFLCQPPVVNPDDTDTDTSPCAPGAVQDCASVCWPEVLVGDGFCDDGVGSAANFSCGTFSADDGDCAP